MTTRSTLSLVLFAALAASSSAQFQHFELYGDGIIDRFGSAVASGDVNADGFCDVVVSAPLDDEAGFSQGSATLISGVDGQVIRRHFGDQSNSMYGSAVALADTDGDGHADPIVSDPWYELEGVRTGRVRVYSGASGLERYFLDGSAPFDDFGESLCGLGDVNADGAEDFVVGAPLDDLVANGAGAASVHDGLTGALLYISHGPNVFAEYGAAVRDAGDVDGDGVPDLVVGMTGENTNGNRAGAARVLSGADGATIRTLLGPRPGDYYGASVSGAGDVDADGFCDILVGATQFPEGFGYAVLSSGRTGETLYEKYGFSFACLYGTSVTGAGDVNADGNADFAVGFLGFCQGYHLFDGATGELLRDDQPPFDGIMSGYGGVLDDAGDINGDGVPDLVTGAAGSNHLVLNGGSAHLLSGADLPLYTDGHELLPVAAASQSFYLDAGPGHAGELYWILGSLSGTTPGIPLDGQLLPLVPDAYLGLTLASPNSSFLPASLGILDSGGRAQAAFVLPAVAASLAGLTAQHAFALFDLDSSSFSFASNAVPLTIVN